MKIQNINNQTSFGISKPKKKIKLPEVIKKITKKESKVNKDEFKDLPPVGSGEWAGRQFVWW